MGEQAAKREQLQLLAEAEQGCKEAMAQLRSSHTAASSSAGDADGKAGLLSELTGLSDILAGLRKLVDNQEVCFWHVQCFVQPADCMMRHNSAVDLTCRRPTAGTHSISHDHQMVIPICTHTTRVCFLSDMTFAMLARSLLKRCKRSPRRC